MTIFRSSRPLRLALLWAAALVVAATPAQAQFGGLAGRLKQKAAEKVADKAVDHAAAALPGGAGDSAQASAEPAAPAPAAAPRPTARPAAARTAEEPTVLPITDAVLDRLAAALAAERDARAAAERREAERRKAQERQGQCTMEVMQGTEYQTLGERAQAAMDRNDNAAAMKLQEEQFALVKRKCGEDPAYENAEEAVRRQALEAGKFTARQFAILEERVLPFCRIAARGSGNARLDPRLVYTAEEQAALRPRCAALTAAYEAVR